MPIGKLLIVVDADIRLMIGNGLRSRDYDVIIAETGDEGLSKISEKPDLIILDMDMPAMDGIQTCREIRKHVTTPIIFLGDSSEASGRILCLDAGGDNYLIKPITVPELAAYLNAAIRRQTHYSNKAGRRINIKDLTLDVSAHELKRNDELIHLTLTEFKLFRALAVNCGQVLTRDHLLDEVWNIDSSGFYSRTIDVHVGRMRRKIGDDPLNPRYILTVNGVGYKIPSN
ncbi:MAG: response regulator transcription factor [Armatimonadetes bacterium]|nr:response regulator transcription factor [Armatimonadota bacterium]